jgi:hypothetical protein
MTQSLSTSSGVQRGQSLLTAIVLTGLLAGTLDATAATVNFWIHGGTGPGKIWRYVASAALGPSVRTGGTGIVLLGLLFHYIVAFSFTVFYFVIYPKIPVLSTSIAVSGLLYGVFAWLVMNLAVVPLSRIGKFPSTLESVITNMLILMVAIGLPIAWMAGRYYRRK